ncbi:hypothetical protein G155_00052 [Mycobacterium sp. VKM Ac-1817D]|nr:hypothetical protein G155_00052 [Mycobacterium sp. VKM Ac-1817D]
MIVKISTRISESGSPGTTPPLALSKAIIRLLWAFTPSWDSSLYVSDVTPSVMHQP